MNIFITGATGYIGGSIAHRLIAEGHQVTGLVRSDSRAEQAQARVTGYPKTEISWIARRKTNEART